MKRVLHLGVALFLGITVSGCSSFKQTIPEAGPNIPVAGGGGTPTTPSSGPNAAEMRRIGEKIFINEAGGDKNKLVHWNVGEDFAAMGIGHFTWYPPGRAQRFGNTFPGLIDYMANRGAQPPAWVRFAAARGAPWYTKQELERVKHTPQVQQLINYLYQTRGLQAEYIVERSKRAMQKFVKATPNNLKRHVAQNINALANTPGGWYPLIDYVNFKGEGMNRNGGYRGQNWGMLQVLELMRPSQPGPQALNNFADAAYAVLARRVRNSPPQRNEAKWLAGWRNRVNTYRRL
ncbi:MAG: hypothetical protein V3U78_03990 [Thiotrichaceae bacterium]